ncbi:MAG TPA: hypothetical protein VEI96_03510 [Thermodesulfovibrionales bacterium]|nr:hypothetical protein [Thermodesulfovibrionales bacterium]
MKLPELIPNRLRETALFLPEFGDGEGAWSKDDAMAVIKSLKGTTVAVSAVTLFERAPWGYAPSALMLSIDRLPNEADPDYAARSRRGAADFIRDSGITDDGALFALTFPMWKDVA